MSGFFGPDRFVMGLLRAMADAVVVGAGTVRASPTHEWTARRVNPASASMYADWRATMGLAGEQPVTIVATARGNLDPGHPGLSAADVPVVIATTAAGAERLSGLKMAANVRLSVAAADEDGAVTAAGLVDLAAAAGAGLVLCEGGPHLIGDMVRAGLVDELFLTLAPQLAGRDARRPRLGLVEGVAFDVADAPWTRLVSVRRAADHLFLRYRLEHS